MQFLEEKKLAKELAYDFSDRNRKMINDLAALKALLDYFKLSESIDLKKWKGDKLPPELNKIVKMATLISDQIWEKRQVEYKRIDPTQIVKFSKGELDKKEAEEKPEEAEEDVEKINQKLQEAAEEEEELPIIEQ